MGGTSQGGTCLSRVGNERLCPALPPYRRAKGKLLCLEEADWGLLFLREELAPGAEAVQGLRETQKSKAWQYQAGH